MRPHLYAHRFLPIKYKLKTLSPSSLIFDCVGFIGYPNVGKSSTINKLLNSKKVRVSETPGKTKHFQVKYFYPKKINPIIFFTNF